MITVHRMPNGEPFAVVVDSDVQASTSVAVDRSSVTVVLRKQGRAPCTLIFPGDVGEQVFGPDFAFVLPADDDDDPGPGEPHAFTGGGL